MATILIAHGAWQGSWAWGRMRPRLQARGHTLWCVSYTGLGDRAHLANPGIDLETHIKDVVAVLETEDLREVVLVGHSYGGMVATGVADRAANRISQLVYLDAYVPRNGQSMIDLSVPGRVKQWRESAAAEGGGWAIPPGPMPPDTAPEDVAWATPRRRMHPLKTFEQPIQLCGSAQAIPRTYIYCTRPRPIDAFRQFLEQSRREPGWRSFEIDASHNPHITAPAALAELLDGVVKGR
jgi:pimeloyl-ACP methyl ester carboxylesterase